MSNNAVNDPFFLGISNKKTPVIILFGLGLDIMETVIREVVNTNKQDKLTTIIREFNSYINRDKRTENLIIPVGDGLTVCRKL